MSKDYLQFAQPVSARGYRFVRATPDRSPPDRRLARPQSWLTDEEPIDELKRVSWYQPCAGETPVYRRFVEIDTKDDAQILAFANRYGPLGGGTSMLIVREGDNSGVAIRGEPRRTWSEEITAMRRAHELWELLRNGDDALAQRVRWEDPRTVAYVSSPDVPLGGLPPVRPGTKWRIIASSEIRADLFSEFRPGDIRRPALAQLQYFINGGIARGEALPQLMWNDGGLGLYQSARSLLGLLWLQLARLVAGKGERFSMACEECGEYFEVSAADASRGKKYCSGACKSKAARKRKEAKP